MRNLIVVLGDQLNHDAAAFDGFEPDADAIWMAETLGESRYVWSSKVRSALFLSAMRHYRDEARALGRTVHYTELGEGPDDLIEALGDAVRRWRPESVVCVEPGEWRLREALTDLARRLDTALDMRQDRHFLCSHETFEAHRRARKGLRMEYFYREMRRAHGVLMDGDEPAGGAWNFDKENRAAFGPEGPATLFPQPAFPPDPLTQSVIADVERHLPGHPGALAAFDWPVDRASALRLLDDFIAHRLPEFGRYQDAMWTGEPYLNHSRLSAALNLKLLDPREVIAAAETAYRNGAAPLPAVEGFIRQILGWREYVRGVYWSRMPGYLDVNELNAHEPLPDFYWTGQTDMRCLADAIGQTLRLGYAHHIQRLMVTGLFAMLLGVKPRAVHEWYLAVYADAVEWVEAPNTLGMSQWADGGYMASKPYAATGKYIDRMSDYCRRCPYDPNESTGPKACPFTTLYWDFLARHRARLAKNPRMALQVKNLDRLSQEMLDAIRSQAKGLRQRLGPDA